MEKNNNIKSELGYLTATNKDIAIGNVVKNIFEEYPGYKMVGIQVLEINPKKTTE